MDIPPMMAAELLWDSPFSFTSTDDGGSDGPEEAAFSTVATSTSVAAAPMTQPQQRHRRHELLALRAEANKLETTLAALTEHRSRARHSAARTGLFALREEVVMRQRERRLAAEMENTLLWRDLQKQLSISRRLMDAAGTPGARNLQRIRDSHTVQEPPPWQRAFLASADEVFSRTERTFSIPCYNCPKSMMRDVQVRDDYSTDSSGGDGGLLIDVHVSWLVPFEMSRVADALWAHTTVNQLDTVGHHFEHLHLDADSMVLCMLAQAPSPVNGLYRNRMASKRFQTTSGSDKRRDCEVIVAYMDVLPAPPHTTAAMAASMPTAMHTSACPLEPQYSVKGDAWLRIIRQDCPGVFDTDENRALTRVQWTRSSRVSPLNDTAATMGPAREFLVEIINRDIDNTHRLLEDLLVGRR